MTRLPGGPRAAALVAFTLAGCVGEVSTVTLTGTVFDGRDDGAIPLAGAELTVRDAAGETVDTDTSADDGTFSIGLPAGSAFNLTGAKTGFVDTTFHGLAGTGNWDAADGDVWVRSEDAMAVLQSEFDGCESAGSGGATIEGEVRLGISGTDSEGLPLVNSASVAAYTEDGTQFPSCYLDDDGVSDPSATVTGATGRFAVFGVPPGPTSVLVSWVHSEGGDSTESWYLIWLTRDAVAPMYPAYVDLPG